MTAKALRVTVLDVGQGSGNLIEVFDVEDPTLLTPPIAIVLIDIGSKGSMSEAGLPSAAYVVTQLQRMAQPRIDCLALSHPDGDHINLIETVLAKFEAPTKEKPTGKDVLLIDSCYYGADEGSYGSVLKRVARYVLPAGALAWVPVDTSSFGTKPSPFRRVTGTDVELYWMIANTPRPGSGEPPAKRPRLDVPGRNRQSLVVVVSWRGVQYVATGDATGVTMARALEFVTTKVQTIYLPNVAMLTLPHHGSATTGFAITTPTGGKGTRDEGKANVDTFAARTAPASLGVSADQRYRHPSAELIACFWGYLGQPSIITYPRHYYTAYFTDTLGYTVNPGGTAFPGASYRTVATELNIFTTRYYMKEFIADAKGNRTILLPPDPGTWIDVASLDPKPPGQAWVYTTDASGTTVTTLPYRVALLTLQRELEATAILRRQGVASTGMRSVPGVRVGRVRPWTSPRGWPPRTTHGVDAAAPLPAHPGLARLERIP